MLRIFLLRAGLAGAAFSLLMAGTAVGQSTAKRPRATSVSPALSQTAPTPSAAKGTFQLVQRSPKYTVVLTTESLTEIEQRRHATQETRWELNEYAYVRILPRSVISAPGFQPLAPVAPATR